MLKVYYYYHIFYVVKFGVKYTRKCLCIHVTREHRFLHPLKSVDVILEVISLLNDAIKSSYDKKGLLLLWIKKI